MKKLENIKQYISELIKNHKMRYIIIGSSLLLLIVVLALIKILNKKTDAILSNIYDIDKPILVTSDDKYSYISKDGENILDVYSYASPFYGDFAAVSKTNESDLNVYEIIDREGAAHLNVTSDTAPKYYKDYGVWQVGNSLYDMYLNPLLEGDYKISYIEKGYFLYLDNREQNSGVVDSTGKRTFELKSDYITVSLSNTNVLEEPYAVISNYENSEYIVDLKNGKIIFELDDVDTKYLREANDNIFRVIDRENNYKTDRWLYIESDKIVFDTKEAIYDLNFASLEERILSIDYGPGYMSQNHRSRETYYDIKNKKFLEEYEAKEQDENAFIIEKRYKLHAVENNEGYELQKNKEAMLENTYKKIAFLNPQLHEYLKEECKIEPVLLFADDITYLYDTKHKKILKEFKTAVVEETEGSTFLLATSYKSDGFTKDSYEIYSLVTGASITASASNSIKIYSNYITILENNVTSYYNAKLQRIR